MACHTRYRLVSRPSRVGADVILHLGLVPRFVLLFGAVPRLWRSALYDHDDTATAERKARDELREHNDADNNKEWNARLG